MPGKDCESCLHGMSWHAGTGSNRTHCKKPDCGCGAYTYAGVQSPSAPRPRPDFRPSVASVAGPPVAKPAPFVSPAAMVAHAPDRDAAREFLLELSARVVSQQRFNSLTLESALLLAEWDKREQCRVCKVLKQTAETLKARSPYSWQRLLKTHHAFEDFANAYHLTTKHAADLFGLPDDEVHSRAYAMVLEQAQASVTGQGLYAGEDEELGLIAGWRSWKLQQDEQGFALVPPVYGAKDHWVRYRDVESRCDREPPYTYDRALSLQHLMRKADEAKVNPVTLEVQVSRDACTCGLYCWTHFKEFCEQGYRKFAEVSANVIPWGTVQMAADGLSLRTSDFFIQRLVVYKGRGGTTLNGVVAPAFDGYNLRNEWGQYVPQWTNPTDLMYDNMCQALANQFETQVDLALRTSNEKWSDGVNVVKTYQPVVLPDWMRSGLLVKTEEEGVSV